MKKITLWTAAPLLLVLSGCSGTIESNCNGQHDYGCPPYSEDRTVWNAPKVQAPAPVFVVKEEPAPAPEPVLEPPPAPAPEPVDTQIMTKADEMDYHKGVKK